MDRKQDETNRTCRREDRLKAVMEQVVQLQDSVTQLQRLTGDLKEENSLLKENNSKLVELLSHTKGLQDLGTVRITDLELPLHSHLVHKPVHCHRQHSTRCSHKQRCHKMGTKTYTKTAAEG